MKENARRIIIILCHGESPSARALALLRIPSASLRFLPPSPSSSFHSLSFPFPHRPNLHTALCFSPPTNGGTFCFTFVLISDERHIRELYVWSRALGNLKFSFTVTRKYIVRGCIRRVKSNNSIFHIPHILCDNKIKLRKLCMVYIKRNNIY